MRLGCMQCCGYAHGQVLYPCLPLTYQCTVTIVLMYRMTTHTLCAARPLPPPKKTPCNLPPQVREPPAAAAAARAHGAAASTPLPRTAATPQPSLQNLLLPRHGRRRPHRRHLHLQQQLGAPQALAPAAAAVAAAVAVVEEPRRVPAPLPAAAPRAPRQPARQRTARPTASAAAAGGVKPRGPAAARICKSAKRPPTTIIMVQWAGAGAKRKFRLPCTCGVPCPQPPPPPSFEGCVCKVDAAAVTCSAADAGAVAGPCCGCGCTPRLEPSRVTPSSTRSRGASRQAWAPQGGGGTADAAKQVAGEVAEGRALAWHYGSKQGASHASGVCLGRALPLLLLLVLLPACLPASLAGCLRLPACLPGRTCLEGWLPITAHG